MHKFNMSFVFHFYILGLTSWIWTSPSTERLKFESPSKWNSYESFNLEHWSNRWPFLLNDILAPSMANPCGIWMIMSITPLLLRFSSYHLWEPILQLSVTCIWSGKRILVFCLISPSLSVAHCQFSSEEECLTRKEKIASNHTCAYFNCDHLQLIQN